MAGLDLSKQVGPMPMGAWLALVAGGLGVAWYTQRNKAAGTPTVARDLTGDPAVGTGPGWTAISVPSSDPGMVAKPATNEEWSVVAINYLIAHGYDPNVSDSAVRKYLQATQLSTQEYALIHIVLAALGSLPQPLPDPPPAPVPTPIPDPVPPPTNNPVPSQVISMSGRYVWVQRTKPDNTLWGIAQHYYGNGALWPTIWSHNYLGQTRPDGTHGEIWNPNLLYPGEKLWVP